MHCLAFSLLTGALHGYCRYLALAGKPAIITITIINIIVIDDVTLLSVIVFSQCRCVLARGTSFGHPDRYPALAETPVRHDYYFSVSNIVRAVADPGAAE